MRIEKVVAPFVSVEYIEETRKNFPRMRDVHIPVLSTDEEAVAHALIVVNHRLFNDGGTVSEVMSVELKEGKSWVVLIAVDESGVS